MSANDKRMWTEHWTNMVRVGGAAREKCQFAESRHKKKSRLCETLSTKQTTQSKRKRKHIRSSFPLLSHSSHVCRVFMASQRAPWMCRVRFTLIHIFCLYRKVFFFFFCHSGLFCSAGSIKILRSLLIATAMDFLCHPHRVCLWNAFATKPMQIIFTIALRVIYILQLAVSSLFIWIKSFLLLFAVGGCCWCWCRSLISFCLFSIIDFIDHSPSNTKSMWCETREEADTMPRYEIKKIWAKETD